MALVSIPDRYHQQLTALATAKLPVDKLVVRQLERFAAVPPTARVVVLHGQALQDLEETLGGGPLQSGEDLLERIHQRAGVTLGDIRLSFSQPQLEEIQRRAEKTGRTPQDLLQDLVAQVSRDLFWASGETV
jgi:hypothetical protein